MNSFPKISTETFSLSFYIFETYGVMEKWSKIKLETIEYIIKLVRKDERSSQSVTCWLSDFTSVWSETLSSEEVLHRCMKFNPLLACEGMKKRILATVATVPKNAANVNLLKGNSNHLLHINIKYYINDGYDDIPLKLYWQLEKGSTQSFYENFTKTTLQKMIYLEKTNDDLVERIRSQDKEIQKYIMTNRTNRKKGLIKKDVKPVSQNSSEIIIIEDDEDTVDPKDDEKVRACTASSTNNPKFISIGVNTEKHNTLCVCYNCGKSILNLKYKCIDCMNSPYTRTSRRR